MKKKKLYIPIICIAILLIIGGIFLYRVITNEDKLTSEERTWINDNINNVSNVQIVKDENIFSKDGSGIFNIFLDDLEKEYNIKTNPINFEEPDNTTSNDIKFAYSKYLNADDIIFYTDHYVLVSRDYQIFSDHTALDGLTIGVLASDIDYIKGYLKDINITYNSYDTIDNLIKSLNTNNYIIMPRIKYLDVILQNNLEIVYHFSDIKTYYTLKENDSTLSSILTKFYHKWEKNLDDLVKKEEFKIFTNSLNISATEVDKLLSIDYNYGFVNNSPYEIIMGGNYGGIIATYLQEFSRFSGVYFDITKYKNNEKLNDAINKNKVDLYFDFNLNFNNSNFKETTNGIISSLSIIANRKNNKVFASLYSLQGEEVYVLNNSNLMNYLNNIGNIKIHTYNNDKELFKLNKEDKIIVMDSYIYDYYKDNKLNNYTLKYQGFITDNYQFKIKTEYEVLNKLLNKYINYLDADVMINKGLNNHLETIKSGSLLNNIARYFILFIVGIFVIGLVVYRKSKKIRIAKKLKKDDKIRFIDELTLLKNRAYLSDFMKTWSNNNIYPQTIIVIDLNRLQEINDKYGVAEGDKQIQGAANALIKTQLDNSELMRSDGNEFVVYTIGYSQKQIINYIHKLNKELKKLPYDYGAEFGYSIIENNLKTIEDALTEAILDMKEKKASGTSEKKNK